MQAFLLDLLMSFLVGGLWVMTASVAAQRLGGKIGGFIAGLPSTSALSIFFITYTEGAMHAFELSGAFPLTISVNALFLASFAWLSKNRFAPGLCLALLIWVCAEGILYYLHPQNFYLSITVGMILFLSCFILHKSLKIQQIKLPHVDFSIKNLLIRGFAGGLIVVISMTGSRFGGPVLGGILSAFPATIVATLVITEIYGGKGFARTMAGPMMISGIINCMVFILAYRHVVLEMHVFHAFGISYGLTIISAAITFTIMNMKKPALWKNKDSEVL